MSALQAEYLQSKKKFEEKLEELKKLKAEIREPRNYTLWTIRKLRKDSESLYEKLKELSTIAVDVAKQAAADNSSGHRQETFNFIILIKDSIQYEYYYPLDKRYSFLVNRFNIVIAYFATFISIAGLVISLWPIINDDHQAPLFRELHKIEYKIDHQNLKGNDTAKKGKAPLT